MEDYKAQLSITMNGLMVNIRGESDEAVAMRTPAWFDRLADYKKRLNNLEADVAFSPETLHAKSVDQFKDTKCGLCKAECWDNRANKKSPKGPDFKCKTCGGAGWIQKDGKISWKPGLS